MLRPSRTDGSGKNPGAPESHPTRTPGKAAHSRKHPSYNPGVNLGKHEGGVSAFPRSSGLEFDPCDEPGPIRRDRDLAILPEGWPSRTKAGRPGIHGRGLDPAVEARGHDPRRGVERRIVRMDLFHRR